MADGVTADVRLLADRYQIGELLGRGGMADVHAGMDARLGRRVAIKLLKPSLANDPAFRTRFRQEAQAAARMAHPTIVRVFDAGEETVRDPAGNEIQVPFIVMEHVDGRLLKDVVAQGPLDPAEAGRIVDGILVALEYSHRAGVVHRDIKPGNVMVTSSGQVKVMDFGIARAISDSSATIAQTSAILGTAQYFSPEQARGEAVDARTDLYSTGVVLYELLTGRPPFQGETAVATAYQHVSEAPIPPNALNPAVSPALNAVVMRALAKDRTERYQTAADFRSDLEIALAGKVPDRAPVESDFDSALFGVNPTATSASEATLRRLADDADDRVPRTQTRPPVAWIWGIIALVAVIVAAAGFYAITLAPTSLVGQNVAVEIPDVVGDTWENGGNTLLELGLNPVKSDQASDTIPEGTIMAVDPEVGTRLSPGQDVEVTVSSGLPKVALAGLTFKTEDQAKKIIKDLGLTYGETTVTYSPNVAKGAVIGILLPPGTDLITSAQQVVKGSTVNLVVSNGLVKVPDLTGKSVTQAQATLTGSNLQLSVKLTPDNSCSGMTVTSQSLKGEQKQKSLVELVYCNG
ncbi:MAG TPA: Stk1 family PASTA domain-containing Ser/Thr kinase [Pseudolysinimonas sp.]|nr:Stk1 family PASTA domain-containing Ser/Thr kinase [Pseudolysinimonas sp.]